jgi:hypothetical protein
MQDFFQISPKTCLNLDKKSNIYSVGEKLDKGVYMDYDNSQDKLAVLDKENF